MSELREQLTDIYDVVAKAFNEMLLTNREIALKEDFETTSNTRTYKVSPLYPNKTLSFILAHTIEVIPEGINAQEGLSEIINNYINTHNRKIISKTYSDTGQKITKGVTAQKYGNTLFIRTTELH